MGWRKVLAERFNDAQREWRDGERDTCSVGETVMSLPPAYRIAMARELLEGTGHWAIDEDDLADREAEAYGSGLEDGRNRNERSPSRDAGG